MKILSIDFDFFQYASKAQWEAYPSGIDRTAKESETCWSTAYAACRTLSAVKAKKRELNRLKTLLLCQNRDIPVKIASSHKEIYEFVHKYQAENNKLTVVNIDAHHDFYNNNPNLDCGNWVKFLSEEYDMNWFWIADEVMLEMYGFSKFDTEKSIPVNLDCLKNKQFDAVFVCRSDSWTPPHLDNHFAALCEMINMYFTNVEMETNIDKPRQLV